MTYSWIPWVLCCVHGVDCVSCGGFDLSVSLRPGESAVPLTCVVKDPVSSSPHPRLSGAPVCRYLAAGTPAQQPWGWG